MKKKTFKVKSLRTDWNKFVKEMDNSYDEFLSSECENSSPSEQYAIFMNTIVKALRACTLKITRNEYENEKPRFVVGQ